VHTKILAVDGIMDHARALQDVEDPRQRPGLDPAPHAKRRPADDQLDLANVGRGGHRKLVRDLDD
jgi:hypothetical protein